MRTENTEGTFGAELPTVSSAEIARIIGDARLMRAETQAALLRSAGRGIARLGRRAWVTLLAASRPTRGGMRRA
ncbi:MAG TPA: hypothetical protein VF606_00465 [Geminicoccaceae bacterium]